VDAIVGTPTQGVNIMSSDNNFSALHLAYALYLAVSIGMTVWVARELSGTGETFLIRCFGQDQELARSTNRLLVIGFYLMNLGFICYRLGFWVPGEMNLVAEIASRIGVTLLVLGAMHFFNMVMIARMGRTVGGWLAEQQSDMQMANEAATPPPLPRR
jgi:hypothetical protein